MSFTAPIQLPGLTLDPRWYRRAVVYEVMVRFLRRQQLRRRRRPCRLRDGGYDVSDYRSSLPEFGTLEEFKELVTRAHERNRRIVLDLPLNHTSDQHDWFQQSRENPDGP